MRRMLAMALGLGFLATAYGGSQPPSGQEVEEEVRETMRRSLAGEEIRQTDSGLDPCAILGNGMVSEVFGIDSSAVTLRAGSSRHPLCMASWRKEDADAIEAAAPQQMMDYMRRRMAAQQKGEAFDEQMPIQRTDNETSLTIANETFDSAGAAAASLEELVARLREGISVEVRGRQHTTQVDYDDWITGVGDRAAWAPRLSQLAVAAKGVIFHVSVQVSEDPAENRSHAIELARKVAETL